LKGVRSMNTRSIRRKRGSLTDGRALIWPALVLWLSFLAWSPAVLAGLPQVATGEEQCRWYSVHLGQETIGYIKEIGSRIQQDGHWFWKSVTELKLPYDVSDSRLR